MALISTLTDNFNDNSIDAAKWGTVLSGGMTVEEINNQIEIDSVIDIYAYGQLRSLVGYDLTGSAQTIKIIDVGNQSLLYWTVYFESRSTTTGKFRWLINDGNITIVSQTSGTVRWTDTYVANTYRWLKIRESGGNIYYDYSADGVNWTNAYSEAVEITITSMQAYLWADIEAAASTTTAKVDDFNILPSATRRIIFIQ